jgi:hypothetical protein
LRRGKLQNEEGGSGLSATTVSRGAVAEHLCTIARICSADLVRGMVLVSRLSISKENIVLEKQRLIDMYVYDNKGDHFQDRVGEIIRVYAV